jgi:hypothetical protein
VLLVVMAEDDDGWESPEAALSWTGGCGGCGGSRPRPDDTLEGGEEKTRALATVLLAPVVCFSRVDLSGAQLLSLT